MILGTFDIYVVFMMLYICFQKSIAIYYLIQYQINGKLLRKWSSLGKTDVFRMMHLLLAKQQGISYYLSVGKVQFPKFTNEIFIAYIIDESKFVTNQTKEFDMDTIISIFLQNYKMEEKYFQKAYVEKDAKFYDNYEMYSIKQDLLNIISDITKNEPNIKIKYINL